MPRESQKKKRERAAEIVTILKDHYPAVDIALDFDSPFQLIIATILSAQCTDERVNKVTPGLFKKWNTPRDFVNADIEKLKEAIHSTGFFNQKAKSIVNCCRALLDNFNGEVPADFDDLASLPGVGRKTASVVAGNAFGIPAIAVDTHVKRLSNKLGLVNEKNPDKIEAGLKEIISENDWIIFSHLLATHGRNICKARKPLCRECPLADHCPSFNPET
jgi:endonuclease-3